MKKIAIPIATGILITLAYACANRGMGPQGGPQDETPPKFIKSLPAPNQTNFNKTKLFVEFDELIQLKDQQEKVIVSPPQINVPIIRTNSKRIEIILNDSLKSNTTYVVDFSDAIADNNEGNILENFVMAFSTGNIIDSLQISGKVLNAEDLEPVTSILAGIHSNLNDSAFIKIPLDRVASSNQFGRFTLKNIAHGEYRIFALKDIDRSSTYNMPNEDIAFIPEPFRPTVETKLMADTIMKDSLTIDTIMMVNRNVYAPQDIILRTFKERKPIAYLEKYERPKQTQLKLTFAAPNKELPKLTPMNFEHSKPWHILERSATNDSITLWLTDSLIYKQDTLLIRAEYLRTDSLNQLTPYTDTLSFTFTPEEIKPTPREKRRKKDDEPTVPVVEHLQMDFNSSSTLDIVTRLRFETSVPYLPFPDSAVHLVQIIDTVKRIHIPVKLIHDTLSPRRFSFTHKWEPTKEYHLSIDSATVVGINGLSTKRIEQNFKIKSIEDYGSIFLNIEGFNDSAYVVMLDAQDKPIRKEPVINGSAEFFYMPPGKYYARMFVDSNGNGVWDTGDYSTQRQPEQVYYYPALFELRANWDIEQNWNPTALPLDKQKPLEITKNKPKEDPKKKKEETPGNNAPQLSPVSR